MGKKILTIQDISCYGQCSITVALPVLSAYGLETAILPSAILSTHTAGFKNFTVCDLSKELPKIINHWQNEGIKFDALYSGYLGETTHFAIVKEIKNTLLDNGAPFILDPVMGDNGKLYPAFDNNYVDGMRDLLTISDIIIPNITEACFLSGVDYRQKYDKEYIMSIIRKLREITDATIVLTGVSYRNDKIGVVVFDKDYEYYEHDRINTSYHGTGDIYSSSFIGNYLNGKSLFESAKLASDFVVRCINNTIGDASHPYGVKFEPLLVDFISRIK